MESDPFFEPPPVHYDNEERFGTSVEMIAEIRRLRTALAARAREIDDADQYPEMAAVADEERAIFLTQDIAQATLLIGIGGDLKPVQALLLAAFSAIRSEEREACAKVADDEDGIFTDYGMDKNNAVAQRTSKSIAAAIRAKVTDAA